MDKEEVEKGKNLKIEFKQLNGKTRKGLYVYLKEPHLRGKYLKFRDGVPMDAYIQYYKDSKGKGKSMRPVEHFTAYSSKLSGVKPRKRTKTVRQAEQYVSRIKRERPEVLSTIRTGISYSKISDVLGADAKTIYNAKKDMLSRLVLDKQLLNILASDENFKKIKNRVEYKIKIISEEGKQIAQSQIHNKTPDEVATDMKRLFRKNEDVHAGEGSQNEVIRKFKRLGYQTPEKVYSGRISRVEVQMIMRKG